MKNWTLKSLVMLASALLLTACPKKSSNNAAAVPPVGGVCTIGPNGQCVGQVAYTGRGEWNGYLNVAPGQIVLYRQFLAENGLCHGFGCNQPTQFVGVSMRMRAGQGRVTITPYEYNGWSRRRLSRKAMVTSVNNVNSFNMVLIDSNVYYAQPIVAPTNTIQLGSTFVDVYGNVITTTLFYRGVPVATGQLQGQRFPY